MTAVFILKFDFRDPRFSQFDLVDDSHSFFGNNNLYADFRGKDISKLSWQPYRFGDAWVPQKVTGDVAAFNDYPCIGQVPVFSGRAVSVLRDLLEPCGELLPLISDVGEYFAFNILAKSEALDVENSEADFDPDAGKETAFSIDRFEFHEDKIGEHAIFRLREFPAYEFVTDTFKQRVDDAGLNGMQFSKVWPLPPGESWEMLELREKRNREKSLQPLKGQALSIDLSSKDLESEVEQERMDTILKQVATELAQHQASMQKGFVGAIEGVEMTDDLARIWVVCPDSNVAAEMIQPIVKAANWPGAACLTLFRGNRYDQKTKVEKRTVE